MDDVIVTRRATAVQSRDPIDVLAGLGRREERLVSAERN